MTSSVQSTDATAVTALPDAADRCDACVHPLSAHDAISLRFCRATVASAALRACVCPS